MLAGFAAGSLAQSTFPCPFVSFSVVHSAYSLPDRVGTDDLLIFLSHKLFAESVLISSKKALFTAVGKSIKKISPQ